MRDGLLYLGGPEPGDLLALHHAETPILLDADIDAGLVVPSTSLDPHLGLRAAGLQQVGHQPLECLGGKLIEREMRGPWRGGPRIAGSLTDRIRVHMKRPREGWHLLDRRSVGAGLPPTDRLLGKAKQAGKPTLGEHSVGPRPRDYLRKERVRSTFDIRRHHTLLRCADYPVNTLLACAIEELAS
jgi:hypothetical protein